MGTRLIKAAEQSIAATVRLFRWWYRLIGQQSRPRAKAVVLCVGLLALCTVCSVPVAMVNGPKKPAIAMAPSTRPARAEVDPPTTRPTEAPRSTPIPSPTTAPATATSESPDTLTTAPTATPPLNRAPHQRQQLSRR